MNLDAQLCFFIEHCHIFNGGDCSGIGFFILL